MRKVFPVLLLLCLAAAIPVAQQWHISRQQRQRIAEESQIQSLRRQFEAARASLDVLIRFCERAPEQADRVRRIEDSLTAVGTRLQQFDTRVEQSIKALGALDEKTTVLEHKTREGAAREAAKAVEAVQKDVKNRIETVEGRFAENLKKLANNPHAPGEARDLAAMRAQMLAPIVQLNGDDTVGSGVILYSQSVPSGKPATYIISSYHVVRNILAEGGDGAAGRGIKINVYLESAPVCEVGDMVAHDEERDLVLLKLRGERTFAIAARLVAPEKVANISVFTSIYAVGCPLGNDPIPTYGEIASLQNVVNKNNYWMINAPTYFGNSGGGVFLAKTRELAGVFSKIYTHGSGRPTVIPHMGLATPADAVAAFLEKSGYGFILKNESGAAQASASKKTEPNKTSAAEGK